jgi:hypothetical protein
VRLLILRFPSKTNFTFIYTPPALSRLVLARPTLFVPSSSASTSLSRRSRPKKERSPTAVIESGQGGRRDAAVGGHTSVVLVDYHRWRQHPELEVEVVGGSGDAPR